jgi:hypothetical protein
MVAMIATRSEKAASTITRMYSGGRMMKLKRHDKPSTEESVESEVGSESGQDRSTSTVSTRVGKGKVDIDIPALKHLVDTVKNKLKP